MKTSGIEGSFERREDAPELIGKITIMRHGATEYGEEYPGISDVGIEQMRENAREVQETGRIAESDDLLFVRTPAVRTEGSMDVFTDELGVKQHTRIVRSMRPVDVPNPEKAMEIHTEHRGEGTMHDWENIWASTELFNEIPEVFEPRTKIDKRSSATLSHTLRAFSAYHKQRGPRGKTPHVVAVAHFEVLYKFLCDVYELDPASAELIRYGERIEIDVLSSNDDKGPLLRVLFRGQERTVRFDAKTRKLVQI